jgi:hypothetical protein
MSAEAALNKSLDDLIAEQRNKKDNQKKVGRGAAPSHPPVVKHPHPRCAHGKPTRLLLFAEGGGPQGQPPSVRPRAQANRGRPPRRAPHPQHLHHRQGRRGQAGASSWQAAAALCVPRLGCFPPARLLPAAVEPAAARPQRSHRRLHFVLGAADAFVQPHTRAPCPARHPSLPRSHLPAACAALHRRRPHLCAHPRRARPPGARGARGGAGRRRKVGARPVPRAPRRCRPPRRAARPPRPHPPWHQAVSAAERSAKGDGAQTSRCGRTAVPGCTCGCPQPPRTLPPPPPSARRSASQRAPLCRRAGPARGADPALQTTHSILSAAAAGHTPNGQPRGRGPPRPAYPAHPPHRSRRWSTRFAWVAAAGTRSTAPLLPPRPSPCSCGPPRRPPPLPLRRFISNLHYNVTDADIKVRSCRPS